MFIFPTYIFDNDSDFLDDFIRYNYYPSNVMVLRYFFFNFKILFCIIETKFMFNGFKI